jgi:hypothetical protein
MARGEAEQPRLGERFPVDTAQQGFARAVVGPRLPQSQPVMVGLHPFDRVAVVAEGIEMPVSGRTPVAELDAELKRPLGLADEIELVDAK